MCKKKKEITLVFNLDQYMNQTHVSETRLIRNKGYGQIQHVKCNDW